nr:Kinase superfamily protein isoform 1 [Ipomoea batatas]
MISRSCKENRSSYALEKGVRYDGIYRIEKCWRKVGIQVDNFAELCLFGGSAQHPHIAKNPSSSNREPDRLTCTPSSPFSRRPPPTTRHSLLSVRPPPPAHCLPLAFNLRRPPFPTSSRVQPSPPLLDCRRHTPPPPLPICLVKELLQNLGLGEHISHTPTKNMDIVSSLDLALLQKIARRKNDFRLYADELGKGLAGELDYTLEAAKASEFMVF